MEHRGQIVFLFLILAQGAHSIEEYLTRLYEVFAPARFVSSLVSHDLAVGFLVVNAVLVGFGLWCWAVPVRSGWHVARGLVWFWTILELGNGIGHSALALSRGGYVPGVVTAPLLLLFAGWLAVLQARHDGRPSIHPGSWPSDLDVVTWRNLVMGRLQKLVSSAVDSKPLIRNVADTARWVAFYRALETERSDALFRDPYARMLAGERGERIVAALGGPRRGQLLFTTRTVLMDQLVCGEIAKGADMVINLAAGLDARPYRLTLPPKLTWVEVDVDDLITQKEDLLKDEKPVCRLERYRMNLVDMVARRNLFRELSRRTKRAVILSEGLVMYLSPDDVRSLSIDLADAQTFNCWILDLFHPRLLGANGRGRMGRMLAAANAQFRFAPAEGPSFFEPLGWRCVQVESILKAAVRLGRVPLLLRMLVPLFERHSSKGGYSWSGVSLLERQSVTA